MLHWMVVKVVLVTQISSLRLLHHDAKVSHQWKICERITWANENIKIRVIMLGEGAVPY